MQMDVNGIGDERTQHMPYVCVKPGKEDGLVDPEVGQDVEDEEAANEAVQG
jgi:hypothetical protein